MEIRDTTLLRLFFADVLPVEEAVRHVAAMRDRSARMLDRFDAEIQPAAVRAEADTQARFPAHVAAFGRELHAFVVDWCDRLQDELGPAPDG